ncbi:hypothetical protein U5N22_08525 [Bacillus safensis]|uniref:hypothetical protein n=1 Tax=Bacillus safensis TaxID=561879 RepID=UPI003978110D
MAKYKSEKRKAEVGERILITDKHKNETRYKNGDVFKVTQRNRGYVWSEKAVNILDYEYEVIVGEHTPAPNLDEMSCDELIALSEAVMKALRTRSYKNGYDRGRFGVEIGAPKSDHQKRDEIVAKAKEDVKDRTCDDFAVYTYDFIVNAEKRTVVALRKLFENGRVISKGIAKCAPTDCFNAHIGKAIALRRALGLEVPAEYLNVPQPTEVRDGDYVEHYVGTEPMVVSSEDKFPPIDKPFIGLAFVNEYRGMFKITDDSRAEGGA